MAAPSDLVVFDDGSGLVEKVQSDALTVAINYLDPPLAAAVTLLGPGLLVSPLLASISSEGSEDGGPEDDLALFTDVEKRMRFGRLSFPALLKDLLKKPEQLKDSLMKRRQEAVGVADEVDREADQWQEWRRLTQSRIQILKRRSALAFLGLGPDAAESDITRVYKRMALELHPDKGGDPQKFQALQAAKRILEGQENKVLDCDPDEAPSTSSSKAAAKSSDGGEEGENKASEDDDGEVASSAGTRSLVDELLQDDGSEESFKSWEETCANRLKIHEAATKLLGEISTTKDDLTASPRPGSTEGHRAVGALQLVAKAVAERDLSRLPDKNCTRAEAKPVLQRMLRTLLEPLAVAAAADSEGTLNVLALHITCPLLEKCPALKALCVSLLEAVSSLGREARQVAAVIMASKAPKPKAKADAKAAATAPPEGGVTGKPAEPTPEDANAAKPAEAPSQAPRRKLRWRRSVLYKEGHPRSLVGEVSVVPRRLQRRKSKVHSDNDELPSGEGDKNEACSSSNNSNSNISSNSSSNNNNNNNSTSSGSSNSKSAGVGSSMGEDSAKGTTATSVDDDKENGVDKSNGNNSSSNSKNTNNKKSSKSSKGKGKGRGTKAKNNNSNNNNSNSSNNNSNNNGSSSSSRAKGEVSGVKRKASSKSKEEEDQKEAKASKREGDPPIDEETSGEPASGMGQDLPNPNGKTDSHDCTSDESDYYNITNNNSSDSNDDVSGNGNDDSEDNDNISGDTANNNNISSGNKDDDIEMSTESDINEGDGDNNKKDDNDNINSKKTDDNATSNADANNNENSSTILGDGGGPPSAKDKDEEGMHKGPATSGASPSVQQKGGSPPPAPESKKDMTAERTAGITPSKPSSSFASMMADIGPLPTVNCSPPVDLDDVGGVLAATADIDETKVLSKVGAGQDDVNENAVFEPQPAKIGDYLFKLRMEEIEGDTDAPIEVLEAHLFKDGVKIGFVKGVYILREEDGDFYEAAAKVSHTIGIFAQEHFDITGRPTKSGILREKIGVKARSKGLLFIEEVFVEEKHFGEKLSHKMIEALAKMIGGALKKTTLMIFKVPMDEGESPLGPAETGNRSLASHWELLGFKRICDNEDYFVLEPKRIKHRKSESSAASASASASEASASESESEASTDATAKSKAEATAAASSAAASKARPSPAGAPVQGNAGRPQETEKPSAKKRPAPAPGKGEPRARVPRTGSAEAVFYRRQPIKPKTTVKEPMDWEKGCGRLTPRVFYCVLNVAEELLLRLKEQLGCCTPFPDVTREFFSLDFLPNLPADGMGKTFLRGIVSVLEVIAGLLRHYQMPTATAVLQALSPFPTPLRSQLNLSINRHSVSYFFSQGGTVQNVLQALIVDSTNYYEYQESNSPTVVEKEYRDLPMMNLDGDFELLETFLIPPSMRE